MAKVPQISDAEWEVMKVVWDHCPLTAGDVVRHAAESRDAQAGAPAPGAWAPRTVKTLLGRLVKKGAVDVRNEDGPGGRRYLYRAKVSRDACVRQESRSFLSRVFDGAAAPALLHFLEVGRLSADEIRQLRQTLQREEEAARVASPKGGTGPAARSEGGDAA